MSSASGGRVKYRRSALIGVAVDREGNTSISIFIAVPLQFTRCMIATPAEPEAGIDGARP